MAITKLSIRGSMDLTFFVQNSVGTTLRRRFGVQSIGDVAEASMSFGTGDAQCNWLYWSQARSLAATTTESFDLSGTLLDPFGATITAATLKFVAVAIHSPDGTKSLRVGPQGVTNAAQLYHGGVAAGNYVTVLDWHVVQHNWAGWTITAGTGDLFPVHNPGGTSVVYSILLAGD